MLERRPDLQRHYRERVPDLWKADFRTATFLSRDGDTFSFGHRSRLEYFRAGYLCRALIETSATAERVLEAWAMPNGGIRNSPWSEPTSPGQRCAARRSIRWISKVLGVGSAGTSSRMDT